MNNGVKSKKGFTLVEVSIVIGVIAVLASVLIPAFAGILARSKNMSTKEQVQNVFDNTYASSDFYSKSSMQGYLFEIDGKVYQVDENGKVTDEPVESGKISLENYDKDNDNSTGTVIVYKPKNVTAIDRARAARDRYHSEQRLLGYDTGNRDYYEMDNYVIEVQDLELGATVYFRIDAYAAVSNDGVVSLEDFKLELMDEDTGIYKLGSEIYQYKLAEGEENYSLYNGRIYETTVQTAITYRLEDLEEVLDTEINSLDDSENYKDNNFMFVVGKNIYSVNEYGQAVKISVTNKNVSNKVSLIAQNFETIDDAKNFLIEDGYVQFYIDDLSSEGRIVENHRDQDRFQNIVCFAVRYGFYTHTSVGSSDQDYDSNYYPWSEFTKFYSVNGNATDVAYFTTIPSTMKRNTITASNSKYSNVTIKAEEIVRIVMSDSVIRIDDRAFREFAGLENAVISSSVNEIVCENGSPFTSKVKYFRVNDKNKTYEDIDHNAIIDKTKNSLVLANERFVNQDGKLEDNSILEIGNYAFENCTGLTKIDITSIKVGKGVFKNCTNLEKVTHTISTIIPDELFRNCSTLTGLQILESNEISEIGDYAFENCAHIGDGDVTLKFDHKFLVKIGIDAFKGSNATLEYTSSKKTFAKIEGYEYATKYCTIRYKLRDVTYDVVNIDLYTHNSEEENITYDNTGKQYDTNTINVRVFEPGSSVQSIICIPNRPGFEFKYWEVYDENSNPLDTIQAVGGAYYFVSSYICDVVLKAIYNQIEFEITYVLDIQIDENDSSIVQTIQKLEEISGIVDVKDKNGNKIAELDCSKMQSIPTTYNIRSQETLQFHILSIKGYNFVGWYNSGDGKLVGELNSTKDKMQRSFYNSTYNSNITLTATFELIEYTIKYYEATTTDSEKNPFEYGYSTAVALNNNSNKGIYTVISHDYTLKVPNKDDYNFVRWDYSIDDVQSSLYDEAKINQGEIGYRVYVAVYEPKVYTLELYYHENGASYSELQEDSSATGNYYGVKLTGGNYPNSFTVEDGTIELSPTARMGYTFKGWVIVYTLNTDGEQIRNGELLQLNEIENIVNFDTCSFHSNTILQAQYSSNEYNITYFQEEHNPINTQASILSDAEKETVINDYNNQGTYVFGADIILHDAVMKTGYTFLGWEIRDSYTLTSLTTYSEETTLATLTTEGGLNVIKQGLIGDVKLYAIWELEICTITYDYNNGEDAHNPSRYTIEDPDITLINPERIGYTFIGWTGSNGATPSTSVTINCSDASNYGDKNYLANWEAIIYTITYDMNYNLERDYNSAGEVEVVAIIDGINPTQYTIESDTMYLKNPTRRGYNFLGWIGGNYDEDIRVGDGINKDIPNPKENIEIEKGSYGNRIYTAKWEEIVYSITYDMNRESHSSSSQVNGKNHPDNPDSYRIMDEDIEIKEPTRFGYQFLGWITNEDTIPYIDPDNPQINVTIEHGNTGNKTYIAKWKLLNYGITYDLNDSTYTLNDTTNTSVIKSDTITNTKTYNVEMDDFVLNNPTRLGYKFIGWSYENVQTQNRFSGLAEINDNVVIERGTDKNLSNEVLGVLAFKANWQIEEYTIEYIGRFANECSYTKQNLKTYTVENETFTLTNPTMRGYTFTGWLTDDTVSNSPYLYSTYTKITTESTEVTIAQKTTGNIRYQMNWLANNYNITIDMGDSTFNIDNDVRGTYELLQNGVAFTSLIYTIESEPITFVQPERRGYTFTGWSIDHEGDSVFQISKDKRMEFILNENRNTIGDMKVTATWTINIYTLTIDFGVAEEFIELMPTSYTVETDPIKFGMFNEELSDYVPLAKRGYWLIGWKGGIAQKDAENITIGYISNDFEGEENQCVDMFTLDCLDLNLELGDRYYKVEWEIKYYQIYLDLNVYNLSPNAGENKNTVNTVSHVLNEEMVYAALPTMPDDGRFEITDGKEDTPYGYNVTTIFSLVNPIRTGYEFKGWKVVYSTGDNTTFNPDVYELSVQISNSIGIISFVAQWEVIIYAINIDFNDTDAVNNVVSIGMIDDFISGYTVEDAVTIPDPTRNGYRFDGWTGTDLPSLVTPTMSNYNANAANRGLGFTVETNPLKDLYYTANWTLIYFTITYDFNISNEVNIENDDVDDLPLSYTWNSDAIEINVDNLTRHGYKFLGWTGGLGENDEGYGWVLYLTKNKLSTISDPVTDLVFYTDSMGNMEFTANWELITYNITFYAAYDYGDGYGGAVDYDGYSAMTYTILSSPINIPAQATQTGYTFEGWTGGNASDGDLVWQSTPTIGAITIANPCQSYGDRQYIAYFKANTYTVTLDQNGGTGDPASITVVYSKNLSKGTSTTKTGYNFAGYLYATDSFYGFDSSNQRTGTKYYYAKNITLVAQWTPKTYKLNMYNGSTLVGTEIATYNEEWPSLSASKYKLSKTGYSFNGYWDGSTQYYNASLAAQNSKWTLTSDLNVSAKWNLITYTISYNLNGGSVSSANPTSYTIETATFKLNNPTRSGYEFTGWTGTGLSSASTSVSITKGSTGDRSYTANWKETLPTSGSFYTKPALTVYHEGTHDLTNYINSALCEWTRSGNTITVVLTAACQVGSCGSGTWTNHQGADVSINGTKVCSSTDTKKCYVGTELCRGTYEWTGGSIEITARTSVYVYNTYNSTATKKYP